MKSFFIPLRYIEFLSNILKESAPQPMNFKESPEKSTAVWTDEGNLSLPVITEAAWRPDTDWCDANII